MESTLGKRIMQNRKQLGLTQDKLAEILGVSPQAISKWENDQSCPDITMLPRLAELFHISTDELLGVAKAEEAVAEPAVLEGTVEDHHSDEDGQGFVFNWEPGKRDAVLLATLVLAVGILTLLSVVLSWGASFWSILWPCAILWLGIVVLVKKFSFFGVACALFGGYFLLENLEVTSLNVSWKLIFPILILLFGLSLLVDAFKKPKNSQWHYHHGKGSPERSPRNHYSVDGDTFRCSLAFGETVRHISMEKLSAADVACSFGELTVDLTGIEEFTENCHLTATCSFGELRIHVPRSIRVDPSTSTSFASLNFAGTPNADSTSVIHLDAHVSFGEITIQYI